ncbi:MAG: hypothetical protein IJN46_03080, partial [Lachnospiraceae bacterium]|nr:hypothetical protein [Lachnospiraceae bacterium]
RERAADRRPYARIPQPPPHPDNLRTQRPPCVKGKRSAVAVVNDSPVDCQSRDRVARRRLSAKLTEGLSNTFCDNNPSVKNQRFLTPPLTQGRLWCGATVEIFLDKSPASPVDCCSPGRAPATPLFLFS